MQDSLPSSSAETGGEQVNVIAEFQRFWQLGWSWSMTKSTASPSEPGYQDSFPLVLFAPEGFTYPVDISDNKVDVRLMRLDSDDNPVHDAVYLAGRYSDPSLQLTKKRLEDMYFEDLEKHLAAEDTSP